MNYILMVIAFICVLILVYVKNDTCEICKNKKGTKQYLGLGEYKTVCSRCAKEELEAKRDKMRENYCKNHNTRI